MRQTQPGTYLKVLALLIPREHKVEHSNPLKDLTDEQLEAMIEYIETSLAAQAGAPAKMIEGTIEPIFVEVQRGPLLDSPKPKNRLCWRPTRQSARGSALRARCDRQRASDLYDMARHLLRTGRSWLFGAQRWSLAKKVDLNEERGLVPWMCSYASHPPRHRQSLQKSLNLSGAISVYLTVC